MKYQIQKNGKKLDFIAEKIGSNIWVYFNGRTHAIPVQSGGSRRSQKSVKGNLDSVVSPMPGKITKVCVSAGNKIQAGDTVVVMEAMKMEYTLKADRDADVKKVLVQEGSQVTLGQVLVEFEKI